MEGSALRSAAASSFGSKRFRTSSTGASSARRLTETRRPTRGSCSRRRSPSDGSTGSCTTLRLTRRIARELRRFRPDAVIAQGAQETALALVARRAARSKSAVILDLHGDWRAPTRLYGSRGRRLLDPLADALARSALRRADAVRTISTYTTELVRAEGIEPAAEFPAFMDLQPFPANPVAPCRRLPRVLFVGVLERYKAFDVLADAWRRLASSVPEAVLHIVGRGRWLRSRASSRRPTGTGGVEPVADRRGRRGALDASTLLVLPSRSEGMGRVVIEAGCRGRAVVGSRVGGFRTSSRTGRRGSSFPPRTRPRCRKRSSACSRTVRSRNVWASRHVYA